MDDTSRLTYGSGSDAGSDAGGSDAGGSEVTRLQHFLEEVQQSEAFDMADVAAIQDAITVYRKKMQVTGDVGRLMDERVALLQRWGSRLDFANHHHTLGKYFLTKHASLVKRTYRA